MPLQTFEITADVPEGWEVTGEYRPPRKGDQYLRPMDRRVEVAGWDFDNDCIIIRPAWQWPEFIRPGWWLSHNCYGNWFLSEKEPKPNGVSWEFGCLVIGITSDIVRAFNLTLPPLSEDWRKSPRQKPEGK